MHLLKSIALLLLFVSCSTRYGFVLGGQKTTYTESADITTFSPSVSDGPIFDNYENDSMGFHIGISEETPNFLTKITYFQNSYDEMTYSFNGMDYDTELEESGLRGSIAWKLGFFQPYIYFANYNSKYTIEDKKEDTSYTALGFGAELEFQLSRRSFIYVGYSIDSHINASSAGSSAITQELKHDAILVGFRYNFQENYSGMKD